MSISHALMAAFLSVLVVGCAGQDVLTTYGTVRGQTIPVQLTSGLEQITSFYGIPYARPPLGDLRFAVG